MLLGTLKFSVNVDAWSPENTESSVSFHRNASFKKNDYEYREY